jgi:hypothetical protein
VPPRAYQQVGARADAVYGVNERADQNLRARVSTARITATGWSGRVAWRGVDRVSKQEVIARSAHRAQRARPAEGVESGPLDQAQPLGGASPSPRELRSDGEEEVEGNRPGDEAAEQVRAPFT